VRERRRKCTLWCQCHKCCACAHTYRWAAIHIGPWALPSSPPVCMWKSQWQSRQNTRSVGRRFGEQKQIHAARDSPTATPPPAMLRCGDLGLKQVTRLVSSPSEPARLYCTDDPKSFQRRGQSGYHHCRRHFWSGRLYSRPCFVGAMVRRGAYRYCQWRRTLEGVGDVRSHGDGRGTRR
jgi:hypothetical protein